MHILMPEEMPDLLSHEIIELKWSEDLSWYETIDATYLCIVGDHYDHPSVAPQKNIFEQVMTAFFRPYLIPVMIGSEVYAVYNRKTGIKGILDYLIFPLLARKLIADTWSEERKNTPIINALAWAVAIPLEVARHSIALALTIAVSPLVILVHLLRNLINTLSGLSLQNDTPDNTSVGYID
ncbi:hypothetical protein [Legionella fallonii]|uniref:hypothetical protein n=1 Tax=Legionella fallonii TaxID=96230 RepID=UPI0012ED8E76|nr:hypothetical protein [Legionella fallonii]